MSTNKFKQVQTNKSVQNEENNTRTVLLVTTKAANSLLKCKLTDFITRSKNKVCV